MSNLIMSNLMNIGRSIRIYLDGGSISGIRHAEIVNWTGQAFSVPRTQVKLLSSWEESRKPGVYFLFGVDDSSGEQALYIGEAENVFERLQNHISKDFWNEVVFFTNKDENLTKSHVKYLESRLVQLAKESGRYKLLNGNESQKPSMPRGDRDAMEEFISNLRILLGVIGHKALEKLVSYEKEKMTEEVPSSVQDNKEELSLFLKVKGLKAQAIVNNEGIIVLSGSQASSKVTDSLSVGRKKLRLQLIETGVISDTNGQLTFEKNYLFASPSQAAAIIVGYAMNGYQNWKSQNGVSLKTIEEKSMGI